MKWRDHGSATSQKLRRLKKHPSPDSGNQVHSHSRTTQHINCFTSSFLLQYIQYLQPLSTPSIHQPNERRMKSTAIRAIQCYTTMFYIPKVPNFTYMRTRNMATGKINRKAVSIIIIFYHYFLSIIRLRPLSSCLMSIRFAALCCAVCSMVSNAN